MKTRTVTTKQPAVQSSTTKSQAMYAKRQEHMHTIVAELARMVDELELPTGHTADWRDVSNQACLYDRLSELMAMETER